MFFERGKSLRRLCMIVLSLKNYSMIRDMLLEVVGVGDHSLSTCVAFCRKKKLAKGTHVIAAIPVNPILSIFTINI